MSTQELEGLTQQLSEHIKVIESITKDTPIAEYKSAIDKFNEIRAKIEPAFYDKTGKHLNSGGTLPHYGYQKKVKKRDKAVSELRSAAFGLLDITNDQVKPYVRDIEIAEQKKVEAQKSLDLQKKQEAEAESLAAQQRVEEQKKAARATDQQRLDQERVDAQLGESSNQFIQGRSEGVETDVNKNSQNLAGMGNLFGSIDPSLRPLGEAIESQGNRFFGADFQSGQTFLGDEALAGIRGMALQSLEDANPELANQIQRQITRNQNFENVLDQGLQNIAQGTAQTDTTGELRQMLPQLEGLGNQVQGAQNRFQTQIGNLGQQASNVTRQFGRESQGLAQNQQQALQSLANQMSMDQSRNLSENQRILQNQLSGIGDIRDTSRSQQFNLSGLADQSSSLRNELTQGQRFGVNPLERNLGMLDEAGGLNQQLLGLAGRGGEISGQANQALSGLSDYLNQNIDVAGFRDLASRAEASPEDIQGLRQSGVQAANQFGNLLSKTSADESRILGQLNDVRSQFQNMSQAEDPRFASYKTAQQEELDYQKNSQIRQIQEDFARRGLSGSSAELNAIQNINNQFGRQGRSLSAELGMQQMGRQDNALRTLSQLSGQEADLLSRNINQMSGLTGQRQNALASGITSADALRQSGLGARGAFIGAGNQAASGLAQQQEGLAQQQLANQYQALGQEQGTLQDVLSNTQNLFSQRQNAQEGINQLYNQAIQQDIANRSNLGGQALSRDANLLNLQTGAERDAFGTQVGLQSDTARNLNDILTQKYNTGLGDIGFRSGLENQLLNVKQGLAKSGFDATQSGVGAQQGLLSQGQNLLQTIYGQGQQRSFDDISRMSALDQLMGSSANRAVNLQTGLSSAPLNLIGQTGAALAPFTEGANQAKQLELDSLMSGLQLLTKFPELKFASNAIGG